MSLFFKRERRDMDVLADLITNSGYSRTSSSIVTPVTRDSSLQSSVKWACQRLRADLVSTTPLDVMRDSATGVSTILPTPPVLVSPDGKISLVEWLYASQFDLDDVGNTFGLIKQKDRAGYPTIIEPLPASAVTVRVDAGVVSYHVDNEHIPTENMWHERQFPVPGSPIGLSPTAYAAYSLSAYMSAQQFAAEWFAGSAVPASMLKNTAKVLTGDQSTAVKAKFKESITTGDVLVVGSDWEYSMIGAKASEAAFDQMMKLTAPDICRYYGVPGDLVDVESTSGSITYANVVQRNLQLLTLHLGPIFTRRETTFTWLLVPRGQTVKFNTDAFLRMDPAQRGALLDTAITNRRLTVTEARALENRPPLTGEQEAEFARLFPNRSATPPTTVPENAVEGTPL